MGRDGDVINMVTSLSVFFRNSLSKGRDIITIEEEKNQVKSYLEIQKIRYSDILDYEINIPESLLAYVTPKLVLQPLVENAIYHGIKHKRRTGKIIVYAEEKGNELFLHVADNGIGMAPVQLEALRSGLYNHEGLGLINVHKRISLLCGVGYGLSFGLAEGGGTTVTIKLPKKFN
jgi:two-component system sensor histidine kinase YesM